MIAVVVPTIREEKMTEFYQKWYQLFKSHDVQLVTVYDGDEPYVECEDIKNCTRKTYSIDSIMGEYKDIIYNHTDAVRNLGFAFVAKYLEANYIFSFDDDVEPIGDTIQDHIDALDRLVPITWLSTTVDSYMRGFPYAIRKEAPVMVSHGVWEGVPDLDAPTQLLQPNMQPEFYKGPIPLGIFYPHCAMNFAFRGMVLPYIYQAPMGPRVGLDRFGDIWGGIEMKKDLDENRMAVVSGYARVKHTRASNVFTNLVKEAKGLGMNEVDKYGTDEYFKIFREQRNRWKAFMFSLL